MPLDEADLAKLAEMMDGKLTEATKGFLTPEAATKMITQGLATGLEGLDIGGKITTALAGFKPPEGKKDEGAGGEKSVEFLKLQENQTKLEGQIREQTTAREAAEATTRQQRLDGAIRDALSANGVSSGRHAQAMAYIKTLRTSDGRPVVDINESGATVFRHQKTGYVDDLSIKDGLGVWTGTDDGKHYLPASGVNGDGQGAGGAGAVSHSAIQATRDSAGKLDLGPLRKRLRDSLANASVR